jgi:uncharacterized protein
MRSLRFDDRYQLRLESGELVAEALLNWLAKSGVGYATMTGLGAVSGATIAYWNAKTGQYEHHVIDEQLEVVSLIGNVSIKEGAPFTHIHVTLGARDLTIRGGHFIDATVHPNLEIWLRPETRTVERTLDNASGLYLMDLPEHD